MKNSNVWLWAALSAVGFVACKKDKVIVTKTSNPTVAESLDVISMWKSRAPKAQGFQVDNATGGSFTTTAGTYFWFEAGSFLHEDGTPVTGKVDVSVTEYRTKADMLFSGVTVTSGGDLLESGGMFQILATQGTDNLKHNPDKAGYVQTNSTTLNFVAMDVWQGEANANDKRNKINWVKKDSVDPVKPRQDSMQGGGKGFNYGLQFNYFKFGYCNIDREAFKFKTKCTKFRIKMPKGCLDSNSTALLLFKNYNCCAWCHWLTNEDAISTYYSLPVGETIKVLVYKKTGNGEDDLEYSVQEITLTDDTEVTFTTTAPCTLQQLEDIIKAL